MRLRVLPTIGMPTTQGGVEWFLALAFVGIRLVDLIQAGLAQPLAFRLSPYPLLEAATAMLCLTEAGLVSRRILRRRRYDEPWLATVDVATGFLLLATTAWLTAPNIGVNSWANWTFPITLGTVVGAAIALRRGWQVTTATALLTLGYLLWVATPTNQAGAEIMTGVVNAAAYPAFAAMVWILASFLRRLGTDADTARQQAATAAQELERERQRHLLHDQAATLSLLSRDDLDTRVRALAQRQARAGADKIRSFLDDEPPTPNGLTSELTALSQAFADLDVDLNLDGVRHDPAAQVQAAILGAIQTALHNIRHHANAHHTTLYAESDPSGWEITLYDDGAGFDPATATERFGLRHQIRGAITDVGGQVELLSAPGQGTFLRLWGRS
jgi:signal transduction histidine kinase